MNRKPTTILNILWLLLLCGCVDIGATVEAPEIKVVESIALQYNKTADVKALKELLEDELAALKKTDSLAAAIIARVFVANKTAQLQDGLNPISSRLYKEAQFAAKQLGRNDLQLWVALHYGFYLYTYRELEEALGQFMFSIHTLNQLKDVQLIQPYDTYKKTAYFLMTVGDMEQARLHLLKAKGFANPNSSELAAITDALGLNSMRRNNLSEAERYFKETLAISAAAKAELRYAKALGNLADIRLRQKKYAEAIALLVQDIAHSKKLGDTQNTIYALALMGKVQLAQQNYVLARQTLFAAQDYAQSRPYLKRSDYEINTLMVTLAKHTGNEQEELMARRRLDTLEKDLASLDGAEVVARMGWKMEKEKLQLRIEAEKAKKEKEALLKVVTLIVCFILLGLIALVIKTYQKKIRFKKGEYEDRVRRLMLDKEASEQKWKANNQSLQSYKTYLEEKNGQIKELEAEMAKLKASSKGSSKKYEGEIQKLLQSHLLSSDTWTAFKDAFIHEHATYYENLVRNFGYLSDANLRIVFLLKLGMNNVEAARILGITLDAVKKSKQRLKRKYGAQYSGLFNDGKFIL